MSCKHLSQHVRCLAQSVHTEVLVYVSDAQLAAAVETCKVLIRAGMLSHQTPLSRSREFFGLKTSVASSTTRETQQQSQSTCLLSG